MPSIIELRAVDIDNRIVKLRIFEVVSLVVHADCNYVVSSTIVIFVGEGL
jgi:hypothetical protein